jgi:hypothetical protein
MSTSKISSQTPDEFTTWKRNVDRALLDGYSINTADAGLDDEVLKHHWASGEIARDFAERLAQTFNFTSKIEWMLRHPISIP